MRRLLLCVVVCWLFSHTENRRNYGRNLACLTHNLYKHESSCPGPRRIFYAFHRIIFNCTKVFTKCPKIHRHNEYTTLKRCQDDCYFHMIIPTTPKPANSSGNGTTNGTTDGAAGGDANAGTATEDGKKDEKDEKKDEKDEKKDEKKSDFDAEALMRANPYKFVGRRGDGKTQMKTQSRVQSNVAERRRRRSRRYH
ncbi:uncharacterized protein LOC108163742 [Drosophila miranda]|uniref:uncharacterized protein LOC108163742 n=1 Tax=Drosophila miranda TaxID=7229 RepID=UPI0007E770B8|nr:uncharacterized protein LOC108163742 [Drosophila miranda]